MKLHFCEAIEIENLKKIKREKKNRDKKIRLPFSKESYFREVWNNQDLIYKDLIGKVCIVIEGNGLKNWKEFNWEQFYWKRNDSIGNGWSGKIYIGKVLIERF